MPGGGQWCSPLRCTTWSFRSRPRVGAIARRESATWLTGQGTDAAVVDDCRAVVSELVGNAVRHAQPLADGTVRIRITHAGDAVDIAVSDGGAPTLPHRADVGTLAMTGRGLAIVEAAHQQVVAREQPPGPHRARRCLASCRRDRR